MTTVWASPAAAAGCERDGVSVPAACVEDNGVCICDFSDLDAGTILTSDNFPPSVILSVENNRASHPDEVIVFDSACPGGCTGGDDDLETPGAGPGNTMALGKLMIIAEDDVDGDNDGLVDDPDDEHDGGLITFSFGVPYKVLRMKAVDLELGEDLSQIEMDLSAGGVETVSTSLLGDASLEMIVVPSPKPIDELRIRHNGSGGWDSIEMVCACGDGVIDSGEDCDPPASHGGDANCSDTCTIVDDDCGDGHIDPGEECDPPASQGGADTCRDDCTLAVCGDGHLDPNEECDPPASQGGDDDCRDDCTLMVCGDGHVDPGEECDPPASQGGAANCLDDCTIDPSPQCGDGNLDPGEECDPPASQGGQADCKDNCTLAVCGDGIVDPNEDCDPPFSQGGDETCKDDCTTMICGDGNVDPGEDCDPPASQGGAPTCGDDCSQSVCGDDEVDLGEECDPPASQGGDANCADDCTLAVCGDGVVEAGEECDPPASQGGADGCRDDCTLMVCGDGILDAGEECDPPASQGGAANCSDLCTFTECGDSVLDEGEECDPPASQGGVANCRDDCTLAICGDGIVDPGEACEPPGSQGGASTCSDTCQLIVCGDMIIEGPEECDPPSPEDCSNMEDDDGDNLVDCQDPDCLEPLLAGEQICNEQCGLVFVGCVPIEDDPAVIRVQDDQSRSLGRLDYFKIHGRVRLDPPFKGGPIDPVEDGFAITLRNQEGPIYEAELFAGDLRPHLKSNRRYRFKAPAAKKGVSARQGLYSVYTKFRRVNGEWYYAFKVKAYGNMQAATLSEMTTQVYGVDGPGFLTAEWVETGKGWRLRRKHFELPDIPETE